MVYSIIHVAARRDLMYYAGLKSLGLTPRQLRRILLEQGCIVSAAGFLPGWLLGFGIHFCITSRVITGMEENPALYFLTWQPFAVAALCTLATTLLAYLLPTYDACTDHSLSYWQAAKAWPQFRWPHDFIPACAA